MNSLETLGFSPFFSSQFEKLDRKDLVPARIASEGRGVYRLLGCRVAIGELKGTLRRQLDSISRPTVGDWIAVDDSGDRALIHEILDRRTAMVRRAAGTESGVQVVAANVDLFFIVTSANRDFNMRRIERYLAAVWDSGAEPVVVLNKIDAGGAVDEMMEEIEAAVPGVTVVKSSAVTGDGVEDLRGYLEIGRTVGLVGSSGVGKSTIANQLLGSAAQHVRAVRRDEKGRHATTRRDLFELPDGAILIDTPGMRELGLIDDAGGVATLFADVIALGGECRFRDCKHGDEPGCAVVAAAEAGELDYARLTSYRKLQREIAAAERRRDPTLGRNSKRRWKSINKAWRARSKSDPKRER